MNADIDSEAYVLYILHGRCCIMRPCPKYSGTAAFIGWPLLWQFSDSFRYYLCPNSVGKQGFGCLNQQCTTP